MTANSTHHKSATSAFQVTQWATSLFDLTFAEPKLRSKYLLKSNSELISPSENMATNMDRSVN